MKDVWGRNLAPGDFVMILAQNLGGYMFSSLQYAPYGIVVSDKAIFSDGAKRRYTNLYKIDNPISEELEVKNYLMKSYKEYNAKKILEKTCAQKLASKDITRGDILLTSDGYVWLYLGKVSGYAEKDVYTRSNQSKGVCITPYVFKKWDNLHGYAYIGFRDLQSTQELLNGLTLNSLLDNIGACVKTMYAYQEVDKVNLGHDYLKLLKAPSNIFVSKEGHIDITIGEYLLKWDTSSKMKGLYHIQVV